MKPGFSPIVKSKLRTRLVFLRLKTTYWIEAFKNYRSFSRAIASLRKIVKLKKRYFGKQKLQKVARVDGKYFWTVGGPSLFSPALRTFIKIGLNKMVPHLPYDYGLQVLFLAITCKCPLRCEHCFEGENLAAHDTLTLDQLKSVVKLFQQRGVAQIQFTGGEPMSRYRDLIELLKYSGSGTDFWINTSGFNMNEEKAQELKSTGLTGLIVSLDHYQEMQHNKFRNNPLAFSWAITAIKSAVNANLPVTLSLCATRNFINKENLMAYADLAKNMGVTFIQLLEPKSTGFYKNRDVALNERQKQILHDFYMTMNFESRYHHWPIVGYHELHRQAINCGGAGDRFLYINSKGQIQACPFCDRIYGSIINDDNPNDIIQSMRCKGCPATQSFPENPRIQDLVPSCD